MPIMDRLARPTGSAALCDELKLPLGRVYRWLGLLVEAGVAELAQEGGFVLTAAGKAIRHDVVEVGKLATMLERAA